jgi:hypothetical protein
MANIEILSGSLTPDKARALFRRGNQLTRSDASGTALAVCLLRDDDSTLFVFRRTNRWVMLENSKGQTLARQLRKKKLSKNLKIFSKNA